MITTTTADDWNATWKVRGKAYHEANARFPRVRDTERDLMITGMDLAPGQRLLDVAAGGGYHLEKVHALYGNQIEILAIEPSDTFALHLPPYARRLTQSTITSFELPVASVDRSVNLSGLHHTPDNDLFFKECHRVLRHGGRCGAADVRRGSPVDVWLNEFVHRNNSEGHQGTFFVEGELSEKMKAAGFKQVTEDVKRYTWNFTSMEEMAIFVRLLFGLDRVSGPEPLVRAAIDILGYMELPTGEVQLNWELIYAFGGKE